MLNLDRSPLPTVCRLILISCAVACGGSSAVGAGSSTNEADGGTPPTPSVTLKVAANPNSVLSAVTTVGWRGDIVSVSVSYAFANQASESTPLHDVSGASGSLTVPVLGLRASTVYSLQATGTDAAGDAFVSAPVQFTTGALPSDLPVFTVAKGMASPGYTLVSQLVGGPGSNYVTIVDGNGAPVWYRHLDPTLASDFQQQPDHTYTISVHDPNRQDVSGLGNSFALYQQVDVLGNLLKTWSALDIQDPIQGVPVSIVGTDAHEIRIQPNGDALLFGFAEQTMDLSAQGGAPSAQVYGDVLERVTADGHVAFAWSPFDHLTPANIDPQATSVTGAVVDFTHANAIDVTADGNYLISLRNLSQIIKINSVTGDVMWKLGGRDSTFRFANDPLGGFSCQHGVRELANGDIALFDDGDGHNPPQSRGVEYALDLNAQMASLVVTDQDKPPLYSPVLGFDQPLPSGNALVTFGTALHIQEFDPTGHVIWDLTGPSGTYGYYRALRVDSLY